MSDQTSDRDPVERLRVLDGEGIDAAVLFPSLGLMYGLYEDPKPAAALCAANNDWLAEYCATDLSRLVGVALLPQQDPALAVAELERCVQQHEFVAELDRIGGDELGPPLLVVPVGMRRLPVPDAGAHLTHGSMLCERYGRGDGSTVKSRCKTRPSDI